jgi:multiple sugar transport system ATP-binding protein
MNTLAGSIVEGAFALEQGSISVGRFAPRSSVVLGFRPEDARIVPPDGGDLRATVFACELTGNETIVTCEIGSVQVVVQMGKDFDLPVDSVVGINVEPGKVCPFDPDTGERLRTNGSKQTSEPAIAAQ